MPQVDGAVVAFSDRYSSQVVLKQTSSDIDGLYAPQLQLPADVGQVLIAEAFAEVSAIATPAANLFEAGVRLALLTSGLSLMDFVGFSRWVPTRGTIAAITGVTAHIIPDTPVLWRPGEVLEPLSMEIDTNAAPQADIVWLIRCLRLVQPELVVPEFRLTS